MEMYRWRFDRLVIYNCLPEKRVRSGGGPPAILWRETLLRSFVLPRLTKTAVDGGNHAAAIASGGRKYVLQRADNTVSGICGARGPAFSCFAQSLRSSAASDITRELVFARRYCRQNRREPGKGLDWSGARATHVFLGEHRQHRLVQPLRNDHRLARRHHSSALLVLYR